MKKIARYVLSCVIEDADEKMVNEFEGFAPYGLMACIAVLAIFDVYFFLSFVFGV